MNKKFNNLKNHKAFTLVEILAAIVVISILSLVVIPSISKYMKAGKDDYNDKLENQFLISGKNYFIDHGSKIPRYVNGTSFVTLGELESLNLISGDFYDSNGEKCDLNMSYVKVKKTDKNKYVYTPCLKCGDSFSDKDECNIDLINNSSYTCKVQLSSDFNKWYNTSNLSDVKATVYVHKNNTLVNNLDFSYYLGIDNKKVSLTSDHSFFLKDVDWHNLQNGKVKFEVDGETKDIPCYVDVIQVDEIAPTCKLPSYNSDVVCTDDESGCDNSSTKCDNNPYQKKCTVFDKVGNSSTCSVLNPDAPPDTTPPICTVSSSSNKWYNSDVKVTATCKDDSGGCTISSKSYTFTSSGNHTFEFEDASGNKGSCTATVNIDKIAPKCSVSKSPSSTWINSYSSNKSVMVYGDCSDTGGSGCKESKISSGPYTSQGMRNLSPGYVYDNAGNKTECGTAKVYIDTTPPKCAGAARNGTKNGNVQYLYTYTDNVSGVAAEKHGHCYTNSGVVSAHKCSTKSPYSRLGSASYNSFSPSTKVTRNYNFNYGHGTVLIYFKIKDVAGNEAYCNFYTSPYTYSYKHSW